MLIARALTTLVASMALAASAAGPAAISVVSGSHQFAAVPSFPVRFTQPLVVRVTDEAGAPVAGTSVTFSVSSSSGDIVIESGPDFVSTTDQAGMASLAAPVGTSGRGFFNISANVVPPLANAAIFLLGQNPSPTCGLPGPVFETNTVLEGIQDPGPVGGQVTFRATSTHAGSTLPVSHGVIGLFDSDRIVSSQAVPAERTGTISGSIALAPGVHLLKARYLTDCEYRGSESGKVQTTILSGVRPGAEYTDMWWKPTESGWGMSLIQHASGQLFVVWYHYGESSASQWLVIPGGVWTTPSSFTGAIYRTTGPALGGVFDPSRVTVVPIGVATLAFTDADHGTFTWWFDGGSQGAKSITRQPF